MNAETRRTDPGRPQAPTPAQAAKLDLLRQQLKDGEISFAVFAERAHEVLAEKVK